MSQGVAQADRVGTDRRAHPDSASPPRVSLIVALATPNIRRYRDIDDFRAHMSELARSAAQVGAKVLLLPELVCVGLLWSSERAASTMVRDVQRLYEDVLTPLYPAFTQTLSGIAQEAGLTIVGATFWHKEAGRSVNSGFVFRPNGTRLRQDKLHPTRPERAIGTLGGDRLFVFDIDGVRCGMAICYDVQFPEVTRQLVDAGLEVLFVPSLTDERGVSRVKYCAHARAIENQMLVCVSPLVGDLGIPVERPVHGAGAAFVAAPIDNNFTSVDGLHAAESGCDGELLIAELDIGIVRATRAKSEIRQLADRRPDLYPTLKPELV